MQTCGSGAAIVVDIEDGDPRHAELVEYSLAAGTVSIAVTGYALIDVVVIDVRVEESFDAGLVAEFGVVDFAARFDEFGETDAEDIDRSFTGRRRHGNGSSEDGMIVGRDKVA